MQADEEARPVGGPADGGNGLRTRIPSAAGQRTGTTYTRKKSTAYRSAPTTRPTPALPDRRFAPGNAEVWRTRSVKDGVQPIRPSSRCHHAARILNEPVSELLGPPEQGHGFLQTARVLLASLHQTARYWQL